MQIWLFQADKDKYDLCEKVPPLIGIGDWWEVTNHRKEIRVGDVAIFWHSRPDPGAYALGNVISEPYEANTPSKPEWRVNIEYTELLKSPIFKNDLLHDPVLKNLDVIKRSFSSNPFPVTAAEWAALQQIIGGERSNKSIASTAERAKPMDGDLLYQQRARIALPLLVRQAKAETPITYSDLGKEMGVPFVLNFNDILGSIGQSIERLSAEWKEHIPPIQCLVISKTTGLPGKGIGWFLNKENEKEFASLSLRQQQERVQSELNGIYAYRKWDAVLKAFSLTPVIPFQG
jgi:predicted RNA-binding protein with PUA-like domain